MDGLGAAVLYSEGDLGKMEFEEVAQLTAQLQDTLRLREAELRVVEQRWRETESLVAQRYEERSALQASRVLVEQIGPLVREIAAAKQRLGETRQRLQEIAVQSTPARSPLVPAMLNCLATSNGKPHLQPLQKQLADAQQRIETSIVEAERIGAEVDKVEAAIRKTLADNNRLKESAKLRTEPLPQEVVASMDPLDAFVAAHFSSIKWPSPYKSA